MVPKGYLNFSFNGYYFHFRKAKKSVRTWRAGTRTFTTTNPIIMLDWEPFHIFEFSDYSIILFTSPTNWKDKEI